MASLQPQYSLQQPYDLVKGFSFHTLTKEILVDEEDLGKLNKRMEPLLLWIVEVGRVFQSRYSEKCKKLRQRVKVLREQDDFFDNLDWNSQEEIFPLSVMFGAYSYEKGASEFVLTDFVEKKIFEYRHQLCESMNQLEFSLEEKKGSEDVDRRLLNFSEKFINLITDIGRVLDEKRDDFTSDWQQP